MRIAIGADHRGYIMKQRLAQILSDDGQEVMDMGTSSLDPVDYPDYARAVGRAVVDGHAERGVLVCGSGAGASIAANKIHGIRAGLAHDCYTAHQMVEHDNANVCCLGARVVGLELAREIVRVFVVAAFNGEDRFQRRVEKVAAIEEEGR
ncbi:MAG TPA: ribose 5-phosphate isomerase B [Dehalococcoidia bacterium]|nr:ribose 5-phosphate isomerase B [Dehalococcoidia bacterium]